MKKSQQPSFFDETHEDLPLFSGTCPRAKGEIFKPKKHIKQYSLIDMRPKFKGYKKGKEE